VKSFDDPRILQSNKKTYKEGENKQKLMPMELFFFLGGFCSAFLWNGIDSMGTVMTLRQIKRSFTLVLLY